jgi:VIT1/CCC1 family predicted Fe2+/Mn2+ transporter
VVVFLVLPFLLFANYLFDLGLCLAIAVVIIASFNYYLSVSREESFRARFLEMTAISFGVAGISFLIGYLIRILLGVNG